MKIISYFFLVLLIFIAINCKDGSNTTKAGEEKIQTKEAALLWTGAYEVDGCGFFVIIDTTKYKIENENDINDEFKKFDTTRVKIKFELLDKEITYHCGDWPSPLKKPGIKFISIEKI